FEGDVAEEVLDELGFTGELLAQYWVLRRDADRTRVEVADAHHDATRDDERSRGEAKFFRAHQRRDDDIAPGLHLPVHLHDNPIAQAVHHQHLMSLGKSELPRNAAVFDARERRRPRAAIVA